MGTEEEERRGRRACRGEEGTTTGRARRQGVPLWGPRTGTEVGPPGLAQASSCSLCAVTRWTLHWSRSRVLHACLLLARPARAARGAAAAAAGQ